jgi:L-alanine-DL-glutamate epimerase-like enolase superfamily enzyme
MRFATEIENWPLRAPFVIARETIDRLPLVHLTIEAENSVGRSEAAGVDYRDETPASMAAGIATYLTNRSTLPTRRQVNQDLPPGGVRNAIDCALWDWEAKTTRTTAAEIAGIAGLRKLNSFYTLSLGRPSDMASSVKKAPTGAVLKLKLGGSDGQDVQRVCAVRAAAPVVRIVVDVNEGWTIEKLNTYAPALADLGVEFIEQPLPVSQDAALADYRGSIPLCADESFDDIVDLDRMTPFHFINIKLDKCGGLTAALEIAKAAKARGLGLVVGSMLGTSLGMAPAFLVGQYCDYVDLDGPLLLARDRTDPIEFDGALMTPPVPALWG